MNMPTRESKVHYFIWMGFAACAQIYFIVSALSFPSLQAKRVPIFVNAIGLAMLIVVVIQDWFLKEADGHPRFRAKDNTKVSFLLALFIYYLLMKPLGFVISTALFTYGCMELICRYRETKVSVPKKVIFSVLVSVIIFVPFVYLFNVRLPMIGVLFI